MYECVIESECVCDRKVTLETKKTGYCLEDENTIHNPVDNASIGNVFMLDP